MNLNHFKRIGATLAFFSMAVVYASAIWGLAVAGHEAMAGQTPASVAAQVMYFVGYAVLAGLMVDLSRFTLLAFWRQMGQRPYRYRQREKYAARSYA